MVRAISSGEAQYHDLVRALRTILVKKGDLPQRFPCQAVLDALQPTDTPFEGNSSWAIAEMLCLGDPEVAELIGDKDGFLRACAVPLLMAELAVLLGGHDPGRPIPQVSLLIDRSEEMTKLGKWSLIRPLYNDEVMRSLIRPMVSGIAMHQMVNPTITPPSPRRLLTTIAALLTDRTHEEARTVLVDPFYEELWNRVMRKKK